MAKENLREIAAQTLLEILEKGSFSHLIIKDVLDKYGYLEKSERAFINRLCNGVVERKPELEFYINAASKTKTSKMKPLIRTFLLMGTYEIYYMDSVPESATCNEYVKLAKKRGFSGLSGFVNGVLRGIARSKGQVEIKDTAVKYSVPDWLFELWTEQYGENQAKDIAAGFFLEAPLSVRVNRSLTTKEELTEELREKGIEVKADDEIAEELYLTGVDRLANLEAFKAGKFYVQDHSSMLVGNKVKEAFKDWQEAALNPANSATDNQGPKEAELFTVIDVCAAPGGKSLHAAEIVGSHGVVEARDLTPKKVALIEENIRRCGLCNVSAKQWDALKRDESAAGKANLVIADLPCSGLGILRKKPDIKYRINKDEIAEIEKLQSYILDTVCDYVKEGGTLIYSTCTINRGENENQAEAFLKRHSEFSLVEMKQLFPTELSDGFFICVMKK